MVLSINLFAQKWVSLYFPRPVARKFSTQPPDINLTITVTFPSCLVTFPDCAVKFLQYFQNSSTWTHLKLCWCAKKPLLACNSAMNNPIAMKKRQRNIIYVTNITNERIACTIQNLSGQGRQMSLAHENSTMSAIQIDSKQFQSTSRTEESWEDETSLRWNMEQIM